MALVSNTLPHILASRIFKHVIFWVVYLPLNAVLTCLLNRQSLELAFTDNLIGEAFTLPTKLAFVYFVFYHIIPLYLERNKARKLIVLMIVAFLATYLIYQGVIMYIYRPLFPPKIIPDAPPRPPIAFFSVRSFVLILFDLFITLGAALSIKLVRVHYKSLEFEQELIREKLQSELSFLRAQTNPHFLFNTLNNLYVLARKKSDMTPDAIMMLSKIMRFVLYECRTPRIAIEAEAKVLNDYIALEKMRYNDRLIVKYNQALDNPNQLIAPLLLLPFVENSFKHGASGTIGDVTIDITLRLISENLYFCVSNTIDPDIKKQEKQGGIGLKNVQRQLDLVYPNHHKLIITQTDDTYKTELLVELNED